MSVSGTGTSSLPRGFSWQGLRALRYCPSLPVPGACPARGFPSAPPPPVGRPLPLGRSRLLPASPLRSIAATWYGILYPLSFAYAWRPPLRPRLTLGGRAFPRNPWVFGGLDSHQSCRYSYRHSHSPALHPASRPGFPAPGTLPYPGRTLPPPASPSFGGPFSPAPFSAPPHSTSELLRTLSRMAASKPTSWLSSRRHLVSHSTGPSGP